MFWMMFFLFIGSMVLTALLNKPKIENARPSGLGDFQVPTATEGRVVPIFCGKVKLAGPNVIWYGDLQTQAINKKSGGFLGIGAKKQTIGYRYYLGLQLAFSRGVVEGVDRIWMGDKVLRSGETAADVLVDLPQLFGGPEKGGGVKIHFKWYFGTGTQTADSYLANHQSPPVAYSHTFHAVLTDGAGGPAYIGEAAQVRNIAIEAFRYPNQLAVTGGKHRIGDEANPICFLYELLVANTDWGIQFSESDTLLVGTVAQGALRAVAEQLADEGIGYTIVFDRELSVTDMISEIERHVDGAFRLDVTDGKYKIILARPTVGAIPVVDSSNSKTISFTRGGWGDTRNELRVSYLDREKEYNSTFAMDFELANREIVGSRSIQSLNFPGIKNATLANLSAAREMLGMSYPLARGSLELNRTLWKLQRGDVFDWTDEDEGVVSMRCRIIKIRYGDDQKRKIVADFVEDIYRLETTGFVDPPPSQWQPPIFDPAAVIDARIWEAPAQLAPSPFQPLMLAIRNGGLQIEYDIYTDVNGGTDNFELTNTVSTWTPGALLNGAVSKDIDGPPHYTHTISVDNLRDITFADIDEFASGTVNPQSPFNVLLVDDELMWIEDVVDAGGSLTLTVHRGAFGTVPANHSDNARVWFPVYGAGLIVDEEVSTVTLGAAIRCRVLSRTATGTLPIGSAANIPLAADYTRKGETPYAPGDVLLSGKPLVDEDWTTTPGVLRFTFKSRNRQSQAFATKQTDNSLAPPTGTTYSISVFRVDTDAAVITRNGIPGSALGASFNGSGFIPQSSPGIPAELDFYAQVSAKAGTAQSQILLTQDFEVFGLGIDFGSNFGGQDTGGANLGIVLKQGDAPFIPEPVPGVDVLRVIRYKFGGTPTASDDFRISFAFLGPEGSYTPSGLQITGSTPEALAQELYTTLTTLFSSGAPATIVLPYVSVSIQGGTVEISSYFGSFMGGYSSRAGYSRARLTQEPKDTTTSRQQTAFIDFWDQEFIPAIGESVDVLAPASGDEYDNDTRFQIGVSALTFDAAVALAPLQDGRPVFGRLFGPFLFSSPFVSPPHGYYANLQELLTKLTTLSGTLTNYVSFGGGTNTDTPTTEDGNNIQMTRPGVTILANPEYRVSYTGPRGYITAASDSSTGYACLVKQVRGALVGRALEQIIEYSASREFNAGSPGGGDNLTAGQVFRLQLDATVLEYTISAGDVTLEGAASNYRDVVMEYFHANLPGGFTGTLVQQPRTSARSDGRTFFYQTLYIRRSVTNTPFTFDSHASYGATISVEIE